MENLPKGWSFSKLGNYCDVLDSMRIPVNNTDRNKRISGKLPEDLFPYYGATGQVGLIDDYIFDGKYVLIGEDGAPFLNPSKNTAYMASGKFWVNNHAHILNSENNQFLCHYLNQVNYSQHVTGTTRLKLNQSALKNIDIKVPPINEQKRIVGKIEELFVSLDKGVESLKLAQTQLKTYRQSILKHAFEGKLTAKWREENADQLETADELLAKIKLEREKHYEQQLQDWQQAVKQWEATGKEGKKPSKPTKAKELLIPSNEDLQSVCGLPLGWAYVQIASLCDVVRGGSPRPAGDPKYYGGKIPFLKVADMTRNLGAYLDTHTYSIKEAGLKKTRLINPNVLLLSNSGTVGVPKICLIKATFNDGIAAFLGLQEDVLLYHYYFWSSQTRKLRAINQGAVQPNLNTDFIKDFLIPICSVEEMKIVSQEIEAKFSGIDQLEKDIEENLKRSETLRQSILKKAFSGQLVAQNPNDESASELIKRIKAEKALQAPTKRKKRKSA